MAKKRQFGQKGRARGGVQVRQPGGAVTESMPNKDSGQIRACWCGGELTDSIHPGYSRCADCATFVLKKQLNPEQLRQFYSFNNYWHGYAVNVKALPPIEQRAVDDFNNRIPIWFDLLRQLVRKFNPKPNLLLEIGCAHGGFLSYCRQHGILNVVGNEPDERTCEFARRHFELPYVVGGLFPDVLLPFERFGVVVGFDVIEHFAEPVRALRKVYDLMGSDGIFLFQIPCYRGEGPGWPQFKPFEHVFLYDAQNVRLLFDRVNLEITEVFPGCFVNDMFVAGYRKKTAPTGDSQQGPERLSSAVPQPATTL